MKFNIFLFVVVTCMGNSALVWAQSDSKSIVVRHVVLETDPNPRFVRRIAELGIPWGGATAKSDVDCIKQQLKDTGLFRRIESRFHELKESGRFDLVLTIEFELANPVYKLKKVEVVGVKGVDDVTFTNLLISEGLVGEPLSLKTADYSIFEDRLFELLRKSIADEEERDWRKVPWLELKLNSNKELEITVSSEPAGCLSASP